MRWETYAIEAEPGSGAVEVRGGGARLANVGDIVIIMTYVEIEEPIPASWKPRLVMLNEKNQISRFSIGDVSAYSISQVFFNNSVNTQQLAWFLPTKQSANRVHDAGDSRGMFKAVLVTENY